jgi:hypothetical protein
MTKISAAGRGLGFILLVGLMLGCSPAIAQTSTAPTAKVYKT